MRELVIIAAALSLFACEAEEGPGGEGLVPVERQASGTVTLGPEEGFRLEGAVHEPVGVASTRGSDLLVYRAGDSVQLKPGEPAGRLVVHKAPSGGRPYRTQSLEEIPDEAPSSNAPAAYLGNPEPGYGFTLLGNTSTGYGRFRVSEAPDASLGLAGIRVSLEYEVTWTELVPAD